MGNRVFTSLQDQRKVQNNVEGNKMVSREIKKEEKYIESGLHVIYKQVMNRK